MAISTEYSHVQRALEFFNKNSIYFAIGKSSPWADDNSPPAPDPNDTTLQELIGYKKVETIHMVVPDEQNGTILYRDVKWRIVSPDQAFQEKAKWVYIETYIRYDELPLGYYRQVGVFTGLQPASGVPAGKFNLLPEEVENPGVLEIIDNRGPSNRLPDQKEKLSLVIEF